jgi:hypothetical protein
VKAKWLNLVLNLNPEWHHLLPSSASSHARRFYEVKEFVSLKGRERPDGRISLQEVKITIEDLGTLLEEMKNKIQ